MSKIQSVLAVSVNFHGTSVERAAFPNEQLYGKFGYGRYTGNVGHARILNLLKTFGITATYFVPAVEAVAHPRAIEEILAHGHEIASHGLGMEDLSEAADREPEILSEARGILTSRTGLAPRGFRAPYGRLSGQTLKILADLGYRYDASFQDDFHPYLLDCGLVEVPQNEMLVDATLYSQSATHARTGRRSSAARPGRPVRS